jgi:uncharacterized protein with HEPN domain
VQKVPPDIREKNPDVEWRAMAGMRDRLIHDYFGVDQDLVWDAKTLPISGPRANPSS